MMGRQQLNEADAAFLSAILLVDNRGKNVAGHIFNSVKAMHV
jgi:hypothetical protein